MELTWIFGITFLLMLDFTWCLRLKQLRIPDHVLKDTPARLECRYDLDPGETLYSVKWYKDGNEFFRYVPRNDPPVQAFDLPGVELEVENCTENSVSLAPLTLISSGRYRCEISGEAPLFQTVSDHRDLIVVYMPDYGPAITGIRTRYGINDLISINCTSGPSIPAATLSWFINGQPADDVSVRGPQSDRIDENGMHVTKLGLEFRAKPKYFVTGDMKIKCLATVTSVHWRSNEATIEPERPQGVPAMESRDSQAHSSVNSRADRVQAGSNTVTRIDRVLLLVPLVSTIYQITRHFGER